MSSSATMQNWWNHGGVMPAIRPDTVTFFHGKITREQAEELLLQRGAIEGLFLLRESVAGNYAVSICHKNRVHHYNVERRPDGGYRIPTGPKFAGPVELVIHHAEHLDGFLTLARHPLERPGGGPDSIVALQEDITVAQFEELLRIKALEVGLRGKSVEEALQGAMRDHLRHLVLQELHFSQPWYHDDIRRREAERRLAAVAASTNPIAMDGLFLVRYRPEDDSYVLSICYQNEAKHYKIERRMSKMFIEGGKHFDSVIEMIDHYHFRQDGLLCKLRRGVEAPGKSSSNSRSGGSGSLSSRSSLTGGTSSPNHGFLTSAPTAITSPAAAMKSSSRSSQDSASLQSASTTSSVCAPGLPGHHHVPSSSLASTSLTPAGHTLGPSSSSGASSLASSCFSGGSGGSGGGGGSATGKTLTTTTTAEDSTLKESHDLISFADWPHVTALLNNSAACGRGSPLVTEVSDKWSAPVSQTTFQPHPPADWLAGLDPEATPTPASQFFTPNWSGGTIAMNMNNPWGMGAAGVGSNSGARATPTQPTPFMTQPIKSAGASSQSFTSSIFHSALVNHPGGLPGQPPTILSSRTQQLQQQASILADLFTGTNSVSTAFSQLDSLIKTPLNQASLISNPVMEEIWEEPENQGGLTNADSSAILRPSSSASNSADNGFSDDDEAQKVYDSLPSNEITFNIQPDTLTFKEKLGGGNFGNVLRALYRCEQTAEIPVAVKMLRQDPASSLSAFQASEREILEEARTMSQLRHRHIVRLLGVCRDRQVMLVMELAPLGPINKYLKKYPEQLSANNLIELSYQVAQGMAYLESCKFVHRDLAARNVLLATTQHCKISDFGMSKALQVGNDYYRAATAGKWPLKWYAPECIYYFRFDSKSDVWSYGVTLWEMFSYGDRPYKDMKGTQILAMLDQGLRLSRPTTCPEPMYDLMHQCWRYEGVRRPTFAELVLFVSRILCNSSPLNSSTQMMTCNTNVAS